MPQLGQLMAANFRNGCCSEKMVKKRLPILQWLPSYERQFFVEDLVAGLTVGLTVIPQGIAYAVVAGLEPQYGLYSAFMGCFVYALFGSCKDVTIGPTAIMSLMVQVHVANLGPAFAILSAFLVGCVVLGLGLLNLGFLVQFISMPVTAGFTSAAAITIASGQVKSLLGLPGQSNEFLDSWENVFHNIHLTRLWDTVLGVATIVILLAMMQLKNLTGRWKAAGKYLSLSRNALVVIGGTVLAYLLSMGGETPFLLTGELIATSPNKLINSNIYFFRQRHLRLAIVPTSALFHGCQQPNLLIFGDGLRAGLVRHRSASDCHPREYRHCESLLERKNYRRHPGDDCPRHL